MEDRVGMQGGQIARKYRRQGHDDTKRLGNNGGERRKVMRICKGGCPWNGGVKLQAECARFVTEADDGET